MPDWSKSMEQSFEYYIVDPSTWGDKEKLTKITNCTITRDLKNDTLGSATIDSDEDLNDKYVRVYLVTKQRKLQETFCLGTYLCQTSDWTYDGMRKYMSYDGYTPLLELKEKPMAVGYTIVKNLNLLDRAVSIVTQNVRAPVVAASSTDPSMILEKNFVAEESDTVFTFVKDLMNIGKYSFGLTERGQIMFEPYTELGALSPRWVFDDSNSSILYPELRLKGDIFDIPNVVEVCYSPTSKAKSPIRVEVVNDDPESPVSTVTRGRRVVYRDTKPPIGDSATETLVRNYAEKVLKDKSVLEYEAAYSHGFTNSVRLGDCVRLNYEKAGLVNTNARVTKQVIHCTPGCKVDETAVYTKRLWGEE